MLSHTTRYKIAGKYNYWKYVQYENVSTCSFIHTHVIFLFFFPLKYSLCFSFPQVESLLLAPFRCSLPIAFPFLQQSLFFPPLEDFTVSFRIPCAKIINKEEVWANVSLDYRNRPQFTRLSAIVSGRLQIRADTPAWVTLSSCFQGGLVTIFFF